MDFLAPFKNVLVKDSPSPLYLSKETRDLMRQRDQAAIRRDWAFFRHLRNKTVRRVRQDHLASNEEFLSRCQGDTKGLWRLANSLTGRGGTGGPPSCLESEGRLIEGDEKLAVIMNKFFIEKVGKIGVWVVDERQWQRQRQRRQRRRQAAAATAAAAAAAAAAGTTSGMYGRASAGLLLLFLLLLLLLLLHVCSPIGWRCTHCH